MKHFSILILFLSFLMVSLNTAVALADDETNTEANDDSTTTTENRPKENKWHSEIQEKYNYSDEQMTTLNDSGLNHAQISKVAHLSSLSDKPIDEILKMRTEDKMGWGKIAKELGVHPGEIGKATSDLRKNHHAKKVAKRQGRREAKMERKLTRQAQRAERRANRRGGKKK